MFPNIILTSSCKPLESRVLDHLAITFLVSFFFVLQEDEVKKVANTIGKKSEDMDTMRDRLIQVKD